MIYHSFGMDDMQHFALIAYSGIAADMKLAIRPRRGNIVFSVSENIV